MNLSENQIESTLRRAPAPAPPPDLAAAIQDRVAREGAFNRLQNSEAAGPPREPLAGRRGVRRWWPLLLPGLATVGFATALVIQQGEIQELRRTLAAVGAEASSMRSEPGPEGARGTSQPEPPPALTDRQDLERLRALVDSLEREVGDLEGLHQETRRLQAALQEIQAQLPREQSSFPDISDRAKSIRCVNNLKQLGLAVRVWATDHDDDFPPDIPSMSQELATPKVLLCPADDLRSEAVDWASYTAANCSYPYHAAAARKAESEPTRVMFSCPIHGHVTLCDGSVQMDVAKKSPERLETRNGGLYLKSDPPTTEQALPSSQADPAPQNLVPGVQNPATGAARAPERFQMSPELARRYGLIVSPEGTQATAVATNIVPAPTPE